MTAHGGIETEFKWRVGGERDLESVAAAAGAAPRATATQVNHFFDTPAGVFGAAGWALRLRDEDGRFFLTAKGPKRVAAERGAEELVARPEIEVELDEGAARAILDGAADPLAPLADAGPVEVAALRSLVADSALGHVGSFRNRRTRVGPVSLPVEDTTVEVVLELDRTEFPGDVVHCEVEVEIDASEARAVGRALEALLARAGVTGRSAPSKAKRFFRALAGESIDS